MGGVVQKFLTKYQQMSAHSKASLWYTICNVLLKGIALLTTPIFTRILSQEQYGQYALFQSWYSIISIFATLNLSQSVYSKGLLLYEKNEKEFTSSLVGLSSSITILLGTICFINIELCEQILGLPRTLILAMFIELIAMTGVEFWAARERFEYKYKKYGIVTITTTALSVVIGISTVLLNDIYKVEARVFSDVFAKAIFGLPLYIYLLYSGGRFFKKEYWKYALLFNLPLIPHFLSTFALNQADRIMIGRMVGEAEAAIYSISYTIATMVILVVTALNNALIPYIYKTIKAGEYAEIVNNTKVHFILIAVLCLLTMMFAPEVIMIFAGSEYAEAIDIIPPIATSVYFIFVYSMFSTVEYYFQKTGLLAVASVTSAGINVILNYIFIGLYGYKVAGYTTLISYIFLALFHYVYYRRTIEKALQTKIHLFDIKLIVSIGLVLLVVMFIMLLLYQNIWVRYSIIALLSIVAIIKRKALITVVKGVLK
ncbi:MAG: lipopolysaccharide biosynthesis protein [Agathobacter sp.]